MRSLARRMATGVVVPLLLALSLPVHARQLRGEDFEKGSGELAGKAVDTRFGRGWRSSVGGNTAVGADMLQFPAAGLVGKAGGTIEVDLVRDNTADTSEALFAFADEDRRISLSVSVEWEGGGSGKRPVIEVSGRTLSGTSLWTSKIDGSVAQALPFPGPVAVGEAVHVSFSWGPSDADCAFFVNGVELSGDRSRKVAEDLGHIASTAAWLYVGGEPRFGQESGANNLLTSVLRFLNVYGEPIDGRDLYANPGKYRATAAPIVSALDHNAMQVAGFSGKLVAKDTLAVTVTGTPGATATFDIAHYPDLGGKLTVDWKGWGVPAEETPFLAEGEVSLREVKGYLVYGSGEPFDPLAPGMEPVARLKVQEQSHSFEMLPVDAPYYVGVVAEMRDGSLRTVVAPLTGLPLTETAPGTYTGAKTIGWKARYPRAIVVGHISNGKSATSAVDGSPFAVDTTLTVTVAATPDVLRADEKSKAKITATVTDANGNAVSGHKVRFMLATTSAYTGLVGGGDFAEAVGGRISDGRVAETDLFGRVTVSYVAGFAAKTAIVVARDTVSNSTGAAVVRTFIQATAGLELVEQVASAEMAGYEIKVSSSDDWLTADGESQAKITAKVTLNGKPVEGHAVSFGVTAGAGTVRTVKGTTGRDGEARALFTAGRKIGVAVVSATDTTVGLTGSVSIELRSDAPAKIAVTVDPPTLPADGSSRAEVQVLVTDINDNPSENVEVEYRIAEGTGELRDDRGVTDRRGESVVEYEAGRTPGRVTFEITVRSAVPTEDELAQARDLALAVPDFKFY